MRLGRRALLRAALGVGAGAVGGALAACATTAPQAPSSTHPLAGLLDFAGSPVEPPALVGAVTVVDFWASWCGPCRQGFRYLDQLYRTYRGDGLQMVGVSVDDNPQDARRFWSVARPRFLCAWDGAGDLRERFGVLSLPTTMLFDADGQLVQRSEGFDPVDHRLLEEQIRRLLRP